MWESGKAHQINREYIVRIPPSSNFRKEPGRRMNINRKGKSVENDLVGSICIWCILSNPLEPLLRATNHAFRTLNSSV
jgi:hypothetical protein